MCHMGEIGEHCTSLKRTGQMLLLYELQCYHQETCRQRKNSKYLIVYRKLKKGAFWWKNILN